MKTIPTLEWCCHPTPRSALACVLVSAGLLAECSGVRPNNHSPNAALPAAEVAPVN